MAGVAQRVDVRSAVVVAHGADEERRAAGGVVSDGPEDLVDRERGVTDREQLDRVVRCLLAGVVVRLRHAPMVPHGSGFR
ncbi:hypothetical protein STANM309S_02473 [Streptomyces tanashiensis]